jgi:hypothetical protein
MDTELILTVKLTNDEVEMFEKAKALSGLRSSAEFIRLAVKEYFLAKTK